jgi:hypothetical protein
MNPDIWTNRFTVRKFSDTNREINPEHLEYLETVLNNLPLQCNAKSDLWIYLDDSDKEIREWLINESYWMENKEGREHMLPVVQSPGMFLCVKTPEKAWLMSADYESPEVIEELSNRHEGMTCGVLLSELLNLDYKVGTFRCHQGFLQDYEVKKDYFTNYMYTTYKEQLEVMFETSEWSKDDIYFEPGVAVCFGPEAEEHFNVQTGIVHEKSKKGGQRAKWNSLGYYRWKLQGRKIYDVPKCIVK